MFPYICLMPKKYIAMKNLTILFIATILLSCDRNHSDDPKPMPVLPIVQPDKVDTTLYFLKFDVPANVEVSTISEGDTVVMDAREQGYISYATITKDLVITFVASGPVDYYVMDRNLDNADLGKIYTTQKNVTSGTIDLSQLP